LRAAGSRARLAGQGARRACATIARTGTSQWPAELDEQVDVAVLSALIPGKRTEQRQAGNAESIQQRTTLPQYLENLLASKRCVRRHRAALTVIILASSAGIRCCWGANPIPVMHRLAATVLIRFGSALVYGLALRARGDPERQLALRPAETRRINLTSSGLNTYVRPAFDVPRRMRPACRTLRINC
jgi:hypothetical protein